MSKNTFTKIFSIALLTILTSCSKQGPDISSQTNFFGPKVTIYFTKANDDLGVILIPVSRSIEEGKSAYETAIAELFLGPTLEEREKLELNTEVPEGSRLIKVKETNKSVELDISSQFMYGGGSESMQMRFRQLRETALNLAKGRKVFLFVDGQRAKVIGGEGLEVPQPLDQEDLPAED